MAEKNLYADVLTDRSLIRLPGEGRILDAVGGSTTFKVTSEDSNDQLGVYEITIAPGLTGAKQHYHRFMDETFIILEGTLTVLLAEKTAKIPAGGVVYVPRFTPHGFRNDTEETVKLMLLFNPAQKREGFFEGLYEVMSENPIDPQKFFELYQKYDSWPVDTADMLPAGEK